MKLKILSCFVSDKGQNKPALRNVQRVCSIPFRSTLFPSYFHSFGMTDNYVVFVEQPFKLDIVKLATAYFRGVTWGSCLKFCKDETVSPPTFTEQRRTFSRKSRSTKITLSFPDLVSRHQQKDGKGSDDSFLRGRHGGFPPHQRIWGCRPPSVWPNQLQGQ